MRRPIGYLLSVLVLLLGSSSVDAAITIGAGSNLNFGDAVVDFGCQDLVVAGHADGTTENLRSIANLSISGGGSLALGAGSVSLGGDFVDAGSFVPGTSRFAVVDACGHGSSQVSGATSFYDFLVTSASGKQLVLPASATQTITHAMTFQGAAGNPLNIVSSSVGVHAVLAVNAAAVQTIDYVNARDNTASAATIAPGTPAQYHSVDAGGLINWFGGAVGVGAASTVPAPLFDMFGRAMLLLGFLFAVAWTNRAALKFGFRPRP
jgi:hypothetical protein